MLFRISLSGSEIAVSTILTAARNHFDEKLKLLLGQIIQDLLRQLHIFQFFVCLFFNKVLKYSQVSRPMALNRPETKERGEGRGFCSNQESNPKLLGKGFMQQASMTT